MSTALPSGAVPNGAFVTLGAALGALLDAAGAAALLVAPLAAGLSALELGEQPMSTAVACAAIAIVQRRTFFISLSARVGVRAGDLTRHPARCAARRREDVAAAAPARGAQRCGARS